MSLSITASNIFAAKIAGIGYDPTNNRYISAQSCKLSIRCNFSLASNPIFLDENAIYGIKDYIRPLFDAKSLLVCEKIGKVFVDKKYNGPRDSYINAITGTKIKSPLSEEKIEAKATKSKTQKKYFFLSTWKLGIPRKEFAEDDIKHLDTALQILFGLPQIIINDHGKEYFENQYKWCGTCKTKIDDGYEIAHGLARKHHKGNSDTESDNLYRTCFDCNRSMKDKHILHHQHQLDTERKEKFLSNDPKSRLGDDVMRRIYEIHKQLHELGLEVEDIDTYNDPLIVYETLINKLYIAQVSNKIIKDDYVLIDKPSRDSAGLKTVKVKSKSKTKTKLSSSSSKCIIC
jgi:hypothetical protein